MLDNQIQKTPEEIARFLTQWNLQALGLSPDEVKHALNTLEIYLDEQGRLD